MKKIIAFLLLLPVLCGCAAQEAGGKETTNGEALPAESTSPKQEAHSAETTEGSDPLKLASDEELIEAMINGLHMKWLLAYLFPGAAIDLVN